MKRKYIHILVVFVATMIATNISWGQNTTWNGGSHAGQSFNTGTLTIDGTVTLTSSISINNGQTLTVQLNGTLNLGGNTRAFVLPEGTTLILKGNGSIINGKHNRGGCAFISGRFIMDGGTIKNCQSVVLDNDGDNANNAANGATYACGGAFYINDGGYFEMNGGIIEGCSTEYTSASATKYGYTIIGKGGAVFVDADYTDTYETIFKFNGGIIRNCTSGIGGGVYVHAPVTHTNSKAVFEMNGGTIEGCQALYYVSNTFSYGGGGVYVSASDKGKGTFYMKKGFIKGCQTRSMGCGVFSYGTMTMAGDTTTTRIEGCYPYGWSLDNKYPETFDGDVFGGGVFINSKHSTFTMEGGIITNCRAASGGGVMVWGTDADRSNSSVFNMVGANAYITRNHALGRNGFGNGGAVYVQASTFDFQNGTLHNNRAVRYGGAVNTNQTAVLNLNGLCVISKNRAQHGGGISQEEGKCTMSLTSSGIKIIDNHAEGLGAVKGNGGALFIEKGELTMSDGTISNNRATGDGGGCSFRIARITGDATVNITGGTISNNKAGQNGGGIDVYANPGAAGTEDANGKNDVLVNFNDGTLSNNEALGGGGIHIDINTVNSTAQMNIGTSSTTPDIKDNRAIGKGGAFSMNSGTINILNGFLDGNRAGWTGTEGTANADGNGGAIYLGGGAFNITGKATISNNKAYNGGAICVENGTVDIAEGDLIHNEGYNFGGGLFVQNTDNEDRNLTFSGNGNISNNKAMYGGGVYAAGNASGKLFLNLDASIQNNDALNGGAIYLADYAEMKYGSGLIRNNTATAATTTNSTAYFPNPEGVTLTQGVGGGVYLDSNTKLSFTDQTHLGLYNNRATNAADDIFACGVNTLVELPKVNSMQLKEFDVPTDKLYWVEDYVTGDTEYTRGTNMLSGATLTAENGPLRYQFALRNILTIATLDETDDTFLAGIQDNYLCLTLGYELIWMSLFKTDLDPGDIATYEIKYYDPYNPEADEDGNVLYRKIYFIGGSEEEKTVVLPTGKWLIEETEWSGWKYQPAEFHAYDDINLTIPGDPFDSGWIEVTKYDNKYVDITNLKIETVIKKGLREAESIMENYMTPPL